ncbi:hypothetical protein C8F00_0821 [Xanthomonas vasicola]
MTTRLQVGPELLRAGAIFNALACNLRERLRTVMPPKEASRARLQVQGRLEQLTKRSEQSSCG